MTLGVAPRLAAPERQHALGSVGPVIVTIVVGAFALLWLVWVPVLSGRASYVGQALGSLSVVMMSMALVLVSLGRQLEGLFGGLDKVIRWHKLLAIAGAALILPHIPLATTPDNRGEASPLAVASVAALAVMTLWTLGPPTWAKIRRKSPRGRVPRVTAGDRSPRGRTLGGHRLADYDHWRLFHRLSVVALVMGIIHSATDASLSTAPWLRWSYLSIAIVGLIAYAYSETLGRTGQPRFDYVVSRVTTTRSGVTDLVLAPIGAGLHYTPGQFAFLSFPGGIGARRHPFTMTSSPEEPVLRFSVKALGDFTSELPHRVLIGTGVTVQGPSGRMDHTQGSPTQVWIAGGAGVTPFMSWLRSLDQAPVTGSVHFFYSIRNRDGDPFIDEIEQITAAHPQITTRIVATADEPRLTAQDIATAVGDLEPATVYLSGPPHFQKALRRGLIHAGARRSRIHTEDSAWR